MHCQMTHDILFCIPYNNERILLQYKIIKKKKYMQKKKL